MLNNNPEQYLVEYNNSAPGLPSADRSAVPPTQETVTTLKGGGTIDYRVAANVEPNAVSLEIARRAENITNGKTKSSGWCLACVNDATEPVTGIRRTNWAIQAGEAYAESKDYVEVTGFDPRGKSLDEIENFLNGLPPGTVAIYDKNKMGSNAPGHAQVKGTDGMWHSDFEHGALVYGGGVTILRAFIPVSASGEIKVGQGPYLGEYSNAPITKSEDERASATMSRFEETLRGLREAEASLSEPDVKEEEEAMIPLGTPATEGPRGIDTANVAAARALEEQLALLLAPK